jgi:hypothetical protein
MELPSTEKRASTTCAVASPGDERFIVPESLSLSASCDAWNVTTAPVFQFAALGVSSEEGDGVVLIHESRRGRKVPVEAQG